MKPSKNSTPARFQRRTPVRAAIRQQGFSIVEAMVGFLVLGITITALFGGFSFGFNTIKLSQEEVRADQILVQKLESIRVYDWAKFTNGYINVTNFATPYSTTNAAHGVSYTGQVSVTPFVATGESYSNTLRRVTATIGWFSEGMPHTRTMTTLVSSNGLLTYKP